MRGSRTAAVLPVLLFAALIASAGTLEANRAVGDRSVQKPAATARASFARPVAPPAAAAHADDAALELGRTLFFDPRLSGSNLVACSTCHNPGLSFGDGLPRAVGHEMKLLERRTPTLLNVGYASAFFWDGRAATLEEQALGPIQAPGEMNLPLPELEARLRAIPGYAPLFERAFPGEPIDARNVARAIAAYERSIVSGKAPFDRWVDGDESAISAQAKRGFEIFAGKGNCATCHSGWRLTDDSFYDIGVTGEDTGRARVLPGIEVAQFAFKTPTLRNVALRAPYMHNGSEATLAEVVELYDLGGRQRRPGLSNEIRSLGLRADEKQALVAFLVTLSSDDPPQTIPALPR